VAEPLTPIMSFNPETAVMSHASTDFVDTHAASHTWAKAAPALVKAFAWIAEQRRVNRTIATLSDLSDRTLADIGIARSDIPRVARYGRGAFDSRA
jgi:uncharacterized protein YjiS (DUF1127 family)